MQIRQYYTIFVQSIEQCSDMNKEILKSVLADYRIEIPRHKVIPRQFTFEEFGNYVFIGIRRAGKSYLLYQRIQQLLSTGTNWDEILYINFEDERLGNMTADDLNQLIEVHIETFGKRPIMFLDEIQNIDGWEKFARRLADSKYRVYITGSNAKMLSNEIRSTLGGRYMEINVYPYDFNEYLNAVEFRITPSTFYATELRGKLKRYFNEYFYHGGFPEIIALQSKRDYLSSIYQKIYLGDIATRHKIENTFALRILYKKIAESIKQPISFSRLTNIVASTGIKIAKNTVINYIEYAKEAWLISAVPNIVGKLVEKGTNPKYYFTDNGILNLFLLDPETSLLENLVAINLLRRYGREDAVYFYNHSIEVDFYIPEAESAIQVSYALTDSDTFDRETQSLVKLSETLPCQKLQIITYDDDRTINVDGHTIEIIPIWKWLAINC